MTEEEKKIEKSVLDKIKQDSLDKEKNPLKRLENNSDKSLKYSAISYRLKKRVLMKKQKVQKKYSELYKEIRWNSDYYATKKSEIESYIFKNDEYLEMERDLKELENLAELVDNLVKIYMDKEYSERVLAKAHMDGMEI